MAISPFGTVSGEVFTALVDMESLLQTELEVVRHLENYIHAEEGRIRRLKRFILSMNLF